MITWKNFCYTKKAGWMKSKAEETALLLQDIDWSDENDKNTGSRRR